MLFFRAPRRSAPRAWSTGRETKCRRRSGLGPAAAAGLPDEGLSGRRIWPGPSLSAHRFGRRAHGLDDVLIAGAAAEVGRQHVKQIVIGNIRLALKHAHRQHQKARRAEAALQTVIVHEGLLHRMQRVAIGETFHGADFFARRLHREHQAGAHRLAIHDYGAGTADAVLAADMGAGLPAILANRVGQSAPRLDRDRVVAPVDGQGDVGLGAHAAFSPARNAARMRCGVAGISSISTPNGVSASLMALTTAAGAPMLPPSPRPLAWVIEVVLGVSM